MRLLLALAMTLELAFALAGQEATGSLTREDEIVYRNELGRSLDAWETEVRTKLVGKIRTFDEQFLQLDVTESSGAASRRVRSSQVVSVSPAWDPVALAAVEAYASHDYRQAAEKIEAAIKSGQVPVWQQRLMLAKLVATAEALGSPRSAGILFLRLASTNPPPIVFADMPLCWTVRELDASLEEASKTWLHGESESEKLLGASWQLFSTESELAKSTLRSLQAVENQTIAQLAVAQSWRVVIPPETMSKLQDWLSFRDRMLEPLQLGPTEFLADRLMRINEVDLALGEYARIATLHVERYHRARRALESAASVLARQDQKEAVQRINAWITTLEAQE